MKKPVLTDIQLDLFRQRFGEKKIFAQCLMPVRGPSGFRKLDYDFTLQINPDAMIKKIMDCGFNAFALVVKDTDGALISKTKVGWNPTGRDLVAEFSEVCEKNNIAFMLSVTSMNDAYRGWKTPNTVSIHIRDATTFEKLIFKDHHKAGELATHKEGEMRVDIPEGMTFQEMKEKIPFLTEEIDENVGAGRGQRGRGYIPLTSFHCPRSEHVNYLIDIVTELAKNYNVDGIFADYIRYDGAYTDLCGCERCIKAFAEKYPKKKNKIMKCKEWKDFREDNIAEYGKKFNDAIKSIDDKIITGWFNLPGPKLFTRDRIAQNYTKLCNNMDAVVPMVYPYLTGTANDGRKWRRMGDIAHWFTQKIMKKRFSEYKPAAVFCVTNSVECNAEEMLMSSAAYDYGLGIALFKFYGTTEDQWYACKLYSQILTKQSIGEPAPTEEQIKSILFKVYDKYPPKNPHLLKWKPRKK
ncbi:MAG: family 10 glycosylhydrolase [Promethearchaeota archaeon]